MCPGYVHFSMHSDECVAQKARIFARSDQTRSQFERLLIAVVYKLHFGMYLSFFEYSRGLCRQTLHGCELVHAHKAIDFASLRIAQGFVNSSER
jgi:hypothetical protein